MSVPTVTPYFPFRRIKIIDQKVTQKADTALIQVHPDKRFAPICHGCGFIGTMGPTEFIAAQNDTSGT